MNTSTTLRVAAAIASLGITFVLFSGVAGLAEPPHTQAAPQFAKAAPASSPTSN